MKLVQILQYYYQSTMIFLVDKYHIMNLVWLEGQQWMPDDYDIHTMKIQITRKQYQMPDCQEHLTLCHKSIIRKINIHTCIIISWPKDINLPYQYCSVEQSLRFKFMLLSNSYRAIHKYHKISCLPDGHVVSGGHVWHVGVGGQVSSGGHVTVG